MIGKVISSYVRLFENNQTYNVLKTTSQAFSFIVAILIYMITNSGDIAFASFFLSILGLDLIFFILQKRESQFKSALFFERNETTPKIMNRYMKTMLFIRAFLMGLAFYLLIKFDRLAPSYLFDAMTYYAIFSFVGALILAYLFKYKPMIGEPKDRRYNSVNDIENTNTSSFPETGGYIWDRSPSDMLSYPQLNPNRHFGLPGYNSAGIYTGSQTAIGGISD